MCCPKRWIFILVLLFSWGKCEHWMSCLEIGCTLIIAITVYTWQQQTNWICEYFQDSFPKTKYYPRFLWILYLVSIYKYYFKKELFVLYFKYFLIIWIKPDNYECTHVQAPVSTFAHISNTLNHRQTGKKKKIT